MNLAELFCKRVRPDPGRVFVTQADLDKLKHEILMKLSELNGVIAPLVTQVSTIATDVAGLKANQTDPELPADAATNIVALQNGLQSLADSVKPS